MYTHIFFSLNTRVYIICLFVFICRMCIIPAAIAVDLCDENWFAAIRTLCHRIEAVFIFMDNIIKTVRLYQNIAVPRNTVKIDLLMR